MDLWIALLGAIAYGRFPPPNISEVSVVRLLCLKAISITEYSWLFLDSSLSSDIWLIAIEKLGL
ncbi:hypothetical protein [Microcoleus sp. bin38.metabat.b11b12b14.051]|uniref:hypothetical protein n=1 Tax=Microcoleus sp. bin38.metabat.b11b12b14.051 TaxID=2742709 RepID=UPI0025CEEA04|nr:hypothetical protein [Microcoleus sp. bin38.metabat.b11b12b14.051]